MKLYGTNPVINPVLFGVKKSWKYFDFFMDRERKGQGFISPCGFVRPQGGRAKLERKDFPSGPAKRVQMGRVGVEGLFDFSRGLGKVCAKGKLMKARLILIFL